MAEAKDHMGFIQSFGERYGPYAFGLLSLLLIWFAIVKPELERNKLAFDEQRAIITQMTTMVDTHRDASENIKEAAVILERLSSSTANIPPQ